MKNNKGMGIIQLFIIIIIIIFIVAMGVYFAKIKYYEAKVQTIRTDMLQIQWKLKDYMDKQTVKGEEKKYLGIPLNTIEEDVVINEFKSKNIIDENEYEKYYVLNDEKLSETGIEITTYESSYFLVNYETYEIIVTKGCKGPKNKILYKLSDIEANEENKSNEEVIDESLEEQNVSEE